jgi:cytosine/adenosine deaminase-related metal-dependent hydrolase
VTPERLLIRGCDVVVTMDDEGTEIPGGSILVEGGVISWVGTGDPPEVTEVEVDEAPFVTELEVVEPGATRQIDGRGSVAVPGLVNTHHHLYQTMTRARAQGEGLFGWLTTLYPVWAGLDAEWERAAARVGLAELALSGCTLSTDHHYVFPAGADGLLEAEIDAAREIGLRFHPCRGSMDLSQKDGGLPPDGVVQDTDAALAATEEAVGKHHDPSPGSLLRIAAAPCSPFSASDRLMREAADLARRLGVRLHTHVAETIDEERYCQETFGRRPIELLEDQGWLGEDVWLAHCVHLSDGDVDRMAATGTGTAWCPSSNLRLGSGVARARDLMAAGAPVGLGVDGSASNDAGNLVGEARMAMLVARGPMGRPDGDAAAMSVREALRVATMGGARCLGREADVGSLEAGKRGDIALFPVDGLAAAGTAADPVAAVLLGSPQRVRHLVVEGRDVVRHGRLTNTDEDEIAAEGHRVAARILVGA